MAFGTNSLFKVPDLTPTPTPAPAPAATPAPWQGPVQTTTPMPSTPAPNTGVNTGVNGGFPSPSPSPAPAAAPAPSSMSLPMTPSSTPKPDHLNTLGNMASNNTFVDAGMTAAELSKLLGNGSALPDYIWKSSDGKYLNRWGLDVTGNMNPKYTSSIVVGPGGWSVEGYIPSSGLVNTAGGTKEADGMQVDFSNVPSNIGAYMAAKGKPADSYTQADLDEFNNLWAFRNGMTGSGSNTASHSLAMLNAVGMGGQGQGTSGGAFNPNTVGSVPGAGAGALNPNAGFLTAAAGGTAGGAGSPFYDPKSFTPVNRVLGEDEKFNPKLRTINAEEETVEGRLKKLLDSGSGFLEQGRKQGLRLAQARGLQNSSLAAGSAEQAMLERAMGIASADAGTYDRNAAANNSIENAAGQFNAGQATNVGNQNFDIGNRAGQFNAEQANEAGRFNANTAAGFITQARDIEGRSRLSAQDAQQNLALRQMDVESQKQLNQIQQKFSALQQTSQLSAAAHADLMARVTDIWTNPNLDQPTKERLTQNLTAYAQNQMNLASALAGTQGIDFKATIPALTQTQAPAATTTPTQGAVPAPGTYQTVPTRYRGETIVVNGKTYRWSETGSGPTGSIRKTPGYVEVK